MSTHHAQVRKFRARPAVTIVGLVLALILLSYGLACAASPTGEAAGLAGPVTPRVYLPAISNNPSKLTATRMGFDRARNPLSSYPELSTIDAGWYQDWGSRLYPERLPGMQYMQTVRVHQKLTCELWTPNSYNRTLCPYLQPYDYYVAPDRSGIQQTAIANRGSIWVIGNEIERRDWCVRAPDLGPCPQTVGQDEILPETYAVAYHDIYQWIKAADPTARIAMGSLVEITPLRLQYMTMVWDAYRARYGQPMPVDFWTIHTFILPEVHNSWGADIPTGLPLTSVGFQDDGSNHLNLSLIDGQVRALRSWIKAREQKEGLPPGTLQNEDLINTEYGVLLLSYSVQQVQDFMINTFNLFLNTKDCTIGNQSDGCRLMQAWFWYSLDDNGFNAGNMLFDPNTHAITGTGRLYRDYLHAHLSELRR